MRSRAIGTIALAIILFGPSQAFPAAGAQPAAAPAKPQLYDTEKSFDANELSVPISNFGPIARDFSGANIGLEWPRGSGQRLVHAGGLWLLANIFGTTHSAMADFGSEYSGGPTDAAGDASDPGGTSQTYYVYKISQDDLLNPGRDWRDWPAGAPTDSIGNPKLLGDQTLYCVFNDGFQPFHDLPSGSALELKAEVHETVWGYNRQVDLSRTMYVHYEIFNRSIFRWPEFYVGLWVDPDLGPGFDDDYAGSDSALGAVYAYDTDVPGSPSPAFGIMCLADSVLNKPSPGLNGTGIWTTDQDPQSFGESQNLVRALDHRGVPYECEGNITHFPFGGDPVTGTGCLDTTPGDKRILLSAGPFDVLAKGQIDVVFAFVVGDDGAAVRVKDNVAALRRGFIATRDAWRSSFSNLLPIPSQAELAPGFANPSVGTSYFDFAVPAGVETEEVQVYDMRGRLVWRTKPPVARQGYLRLNWAGQSLSGPPVAPGVYFFRLITNQGAFTQKVVRLQ